jgi:DNA-binding response OmpR family regulator
MHRIMLVEDDETMRSLLQTLLQIEGYDVREMGRDDKLDDLLAVLHQEKPDMILLDVTLRYFDGFDLLKRLRNDPSLKSIRVLMSSGMDFSMRCYQEGADSFLLKPYMPEELISRINQILGD